MNSSSTVNLKLSAQIFSRFMSGKVINEYQINTAGERVDDALFIEIFRNLPDYSQQYAMSNLELVGGNAFYYVRDPDRESKYSEASKKIQVLLTLIGRHVTHTGSVFEKLTNPKGGVTEEELLALAEDEEFSEILERSDIGDILKGVKLNLIDRGIMQQLPSGAFILCPAGISFFEDLFS